MILYNLTKILTLLSTYLIYYNYKGVENIYLANKIVNQIKSSENIFWKLSQWIISRIEMQTNYKTNYLIEQLKTFYENCPYHNYNLTKDIIEKYYNKNLNEIFDNFEVIPEASGSIGQVHAAYLKNGKKVAVKIKHPDIDYNVEYLCWVLRYIMKVRNLFYNLNFDMSGIEEYLMKQVNFKNEANNLIKLREIYKNNSYIIVPEVYEYNNEFIVMEYLDGENIEDYYERNRDGHWEIMVKFWLFVRESILIHNFLHADLHKGNWKIFNDKIIIFDLGIILDDMEYKEINLRIWRGFECRSAEILSEVVIDNLVNCRLDRNELKNDLSLYLRSKMDLYSVDFIGDIKNLLTYLKDKNVILNFHTLTYLLAFNLAFLNFKNFHLIEDNRKNYFEQHLDRFVILKDKSKFYNNMILYEQLEKDEDFFIKVNKEVLREILSKKENFALDCISSDSE